MAEVLKASPHRIGRESFRDWLEGLSAKPLDQRKNREDVAFRRAAFALKAEEVVAVVRQQVGVSP